ncbi:MAG: transketolase [Atopobiaceae bacterium]|nr:transketolase [Atopobiaceae bacterium]
MTENHERRPDEFSLELQLIANEMRHDIITMLEAAGSGHPGGSLSCADIMSVLWFGGVMNYDQTTPKSDGRDVFILSKGHVAPALYTAYHKLSWVKGDELLTLRKLGSRLQGHPDSTKLEPVEVCTGSLGQGLAIANGVALGFKLDAQKTQEAPRKAFCLLGDGEMQEGSNWEAIMFAAHKKLDNLVAIVDINGLQIDGPVDEVCSLGDLRAKFEAFGWHVENADGHNVDELLRAFDAVSAVEGRPSVILCESVKGKGVSFMENQVGWHGNAPSAEQAAQAIAELDAERDRLTAELEEVRHGN